MMGVRFSLLKTVECAGLSMLKMGFSGSFTNCAYRVHRLSCLNLRRKVHWQLIVLGAGVKNAALIKSMFCNLTF